jgi:hypothetical protein
VELTITPGPCVLRTLYVSLTDLEALVATMPAYLTARRADDSGAWYRTVDSSCYGGMRISGTTRTMHGSLSVMACPP